MQARAFTSGQDIFSTAASTSRRAAKDRSCSRTSSRTFDNSGRSRREKRARRAARRFTKSSSGWMTNPIKAALARFTENIEEELTADYRRRLFDGHRYQRSKAIQKWLGRQTEPDFFDKYEELVAEIIWFHRLALTESSQKAVHFDETASTKSSPPSEKKLVSKPSSQSQKSVGGRKKITVSAPTGSAKFVLPSKPFIKELPLHHFSEK